MKTRERVGKPLDDSWANWLRVNLERECNPTDLLNTLLKNGFDPDSIRAHMGSDYPLQSFAPAAAVDYRALANVRLTRPDSGLNAQLVLSNKLQIYTLEDFMSPEECDLIVDLSTQILRPSTVTTGEKMYRTSSTSDLSLLKNRDVEKLDEKIARTLGISQSYSEDIQVQRYEVGQEFKQHTDYFQPRTQEYAEYAGRAGQRTWTFMVYLNDGMKGGGTKFFALNKILTPKKGMAVIWNNLNIFGEPNPDTLHSGMPVEAGHKIIITKWFRDRGSGPMFY